MSGRSRHKQLDIVTVACSYVLKIVLRSNHPMRPAVAGDLKPRLRKRMERGLRFRLELAAEIWRPLRRSGGAEAHPRDSRDIRSDGQPIDAAGCPLGNGSSGCGPGLLAGGILSAADAGKPDDAAERKPGCLARRDDKKRGRRRSDMQHRRRFVFRHAAAADVRSELHKADPSYQDGDFVFDVPDSGIGWA